MAAALLGCHLSLLCFAPIARAQERSEADEAATALEQRHQLDDMQRMLALTAAQAQRLSLWMSTANVVVAAANVVGGAFASYRGAVGPAIGAFAGAAAGAATGVIGFTVERAPLGDIYDSFVAHRALLEPPAALAEAERAWQARAESARRFRVLSGGALTGVGGALLGLSVAAFASNFAAPAKDASSNSRAAFQGALLGLSGFLFVNGVTLLAAPGPIEAGWEAYQTLRPQRRRVLPCLVLAPRPRAALVGLAVPL